MDLWFILLFVAFFVGVTGWPFATLFCNVILYICDWRDGIENDWGSNVFWLMFYPAAVTFVVLELVILYFE